MTCAEAILERFKHYTRRMSCQACKWRTEEVRHELTILTELMTIYQMVDGMSCNEDLKKEILKVIGDCPSNWGGHSVRTRMHKFLKELR